MQYSGHDNTHKMNSYNSENSLVALPDLNNQAVFTQSIIEAAQNAGCEFLFEIPASLFGFEETRAAAVRLNVFQGNDQLAFILCDKNNGQIHVLSNDEAPNRVIRFVQSYANVLSFFKHSEITSH
jgi:hypothetical protein